MDCCQSPSCAVRPLGRVHKLLETLSLNFSYKKIAPMNTCKLKPNCAKTAPNSLHKQAHSLEKTELRSTGAGVWLGLGLAVEMP